jgi:hypothetical protein
MFSGAFLATTAAIILLFRKSYIDAATGSPIEFEMPLIGKVRTQSPVIAMALIGAGLLIYGLNHSQQDNLAITGEIKSDQPVTVYFVGIPQFQYTQQKYLKISGKAANLDLFENQITASANDPKIQPKVEVSDDEAKQFLAKQ